MKKIFFLFILLISLGACRPSSSSPDTLNPEEAFLIARNQVGPVKKGMTIKQLRALLPDDQMKKLASRSELSAETADNITFTTTAPDYYSLSVPGVKTMNPPVSARSLSKTIGLQHVLV